MNTPTDSLPILSSSKQIFPHINTFSFLFLCLSVPLNVFFPFLSIIATSPFLSSAFFFSYQLLYYHSYQHSALTLTISSYQHPFPPPIDAPFPSINTPLFLLSAFLSSYQLLFLPPINIPYFLLSTLHPIKTSFCTYQHPFPHLPSSSLHHFPRSIYTPFLNLSTPLFSYQHPFPQSINTPFPLSTPLPLPLPCR